MNVTAIIPTLWLRPRLLKRCVTSLAKSNYSPISLFLGHGQLRYVQTVNKMLFEIDADFFLLGNDDQEYYPDCIPIAVKAMMENFPDTDGMIGVRQEHGGTQYAINLLGRKFIHRFPKNAVMCPDYTNYYNDQELCVYARSIDRFRFCEEAVAIHHMPKDKTRKAMRSTWDKDEKTWEKRQRLGLLWGKNFTLLNS